MGGPVLSTLAQHFLPVLFYVYIRPGMQKCFKRQYLHFCNLSKEVATMPHTIHIDHVCSTGPALKPECLAASKQETK